MPIIELRQRSRYVVNKVEEDHMATANASDSALRAPVGRQESVPARITSYPLASVSRLAGHPGAATGATWNSAAAKRRSLRAKMGKASTTAATRARRRARAFGWVQVVTEVAVFPP